MTLRMSGTDRYTTETFEMVGPTGLEPAWYILEGCCLIRSATIPLKSVAVSGFMSYIPEIVFI